MQSVKWLMLNLVSAAIVAALTFLAAVGLLLVAIAVIGLVLLRPLVRAGKSIWSAVLRSGRTRIEGP